MGELTPIKLVLSALRNLRNLSSKKHPRAFNKISKEYKTKKTFFEDKKELVAKHPRIMTETERLCLLFLISRFLTCLY